MDEAGDLKELQQLSYSLSIDIILLVFQKVRCHLTKNIRSSKVKGQQVQPF